MISKGFDLSKYTIRMTEHVFLRALERDIDPELLPLVLQGETCRFGKNYVRFTRPGKRTLICVGEIKGNVIKIFTVEERP